MKKQAFLVASGLIVVCILYFGFTNKPPRVSFYEVLQKKLIDSLNIPDEKKLTDLQSQLKKSSGEGKEDILLQLAQGWNAADYPTIAADYLRQLADAKPGYDNYMRAGNALFSALAYDTTQNMRVNLVYGARYSYEEALNYKPNDIDAQIGLATIFVQGTNEPMKGIMLLRKLDEKYPGNEKINMELGNFSLMSGQYDKAAERFAAVLQKDSLNLQAGYLMTQSYLGLKDTLKAVETLENVKRMQADTAIQLQIQKDINQLKKQ